MRVRAVAVALWLWAGAAHAGEGNLLFVRGGALWQQAFGGGTAVKVAELPANAQARWLEATQDGRLVVVDLGASAAWLIGEGAGERASLRTGPCAGRARPAPSGRCLLCPARGGKLVLIAAASDVTLPLPGELMEATFRGPSGFDLAGLTNGGVVGFDVRRPGERKVLAKAGARSHLLITPNGERAVAVFGDKDVSRVRTFLLDGEGVSRQLGGPAIPLVWSWDSQWLLMQEGILADDQRELPPEDEEEDEGAMRRAPDQAWILAEPRDRRSRARTRRRPKHVDEPAPTTRACVARALGGEVKCWNDYEGMAFSPDSTRVLLRKGNDLYVGMIAGVRPAPPIKVLEGVTGPATWLGEP